MTSPTDVTARPERAVAGSAASAVPRVANASAGFSGTDVMLLAMAVIWGLNFSAIKYGLAHFPPLAFNSLRVVLATVALAAIAFAPGSRLPAPADARRLMTLGLLGH